MEHCPLPPLLSSAAAYTPEVSVPYFISAGVFASCVGHVAKTVRGLALPSLGAVSVLQSHDDPHSGVQGACMGVCV